MVYTGVMQSCKGVCREYKRFRGMITAMENQMETEMEHEMEATL